MWDEQKYNHLVGIAVYDWADRVGCTLEHPSKYVLFSKFIGHPYRGGSGYYVDITKPEVREIIDNLTGPYKNTFFKMYELKNA